MKSATAVQTREKPMLRSEFMNKLVKDNNLYREEDLFEFRRGIWIVKRQGIEKIQYNNDIHVRFEWIRMEKDYAVVKAIGKKGDLLGNQHQKIPNNSHRTTQLWQRSVVYLG